VLHVDHW